MYAMLWEGAPLRQPLDAHRHAGPAASLAAAAQRAGARGGADVHPAAAHLQPDAECRSRGRQAGRARPGDCEFDSRRACCAQEVEQRWRRAARCQRAVAACAGCAGKERLRATPLLALGRESVARCGRAAGEGRARVRLHRGSRLSTAARTAVAAPRVAAPLGARARGPRRRRRATRGASAAAAASPLVPWAAWAACRLAARDLAACRLATRGGRRSAACGSPRAAPPRAPVPRRSRCRAPRPLCRGRPPACMRTCDDIRHHDACMRRTEVRACMRTRPPRCRTCQ
jgi:ribonuclease E